MMLGSHQAGLGAIIGLMVDLPEIQMTLRPGFVEFGWGHPDLTLLPVDDLRQAATRALGADAGLALSYGAAQGPGRLIEQIAARHAQIDGRALDVDRLLVTAGISQG